MPEPIHAINWQRMSNTLLTHALQCEQDAHTTAYYQLTRAAPSRSATYLDSCCLAAEHVKDIKEEINRRKKMGKWDSSV